jgi:hypothetical protein
MAGTSDPYREALVVETDTVWPAAPPPDNAARQRDLEQRLHQAPREAASLEDVRRHTGFCRWITVTAADLVRLA